MRANSAFDPKYIEFCREPVRIPKGTLLHLYSLHLDIYNFMKLNYKFCMYKIDWNVIISVVKE